MKKTITVRSDDPASPITYLYVKAFVVAPDVGFENFSLNVGSLRTHGQVVKEAYVTTGKHKALRIEDITTSSEFITARHVEPPDTARDGRFKIEVTIGPGLPPGLLSETVTVSFVNDLRPRAQLYVYGLIVEDVEVTPLTLTYVIPDSAGDSRNLSRTLTVTNHNEQLPLEILDVRTQDDCLDFYITPVKPGQSFIVTATAGDALQSVDSTTRNTIVITTNNPDYGVLEVPFSVVHQH